MDLYHIYKDFLTAVISCFLLMLVFFTLTYIVVFNRVLDESKKIDAFFNERDKDYSDMIKTLASEVGKYISLFQGPSRLRTLWGQ